MAELAAVELFRQQQEEDSWNNVCCDCNTANPEWASISHGIYISIGASGAHRSLGVKISSVQSLSMDSWSPLQLRMMELGGNRRFIDFLEEHGIPKDMPIRQKYRTRAAEWYRKNLRALAENQPPPPPLPLGIGRLPANSSPCPTELLLDKVFADVPCDITMSSRCSLEVESGRCRGEDNMKQLKNVPDFEFQPHWNVIFNIIGLRCVLGSDYNSKVAYIPDWFSKQLEWVGTSEGCRSAERLKTMSTGKMLGFGAESMQTTQVA